MTDLTRRDLLTGAAALVGGAVLAGLPAVADGQAKAAVPPRPTVPPDPTKVTGGATTAVGSRSAFEHPVRTPAGETTGYSLTPLQDLTGTITPSDLHFERHHAGVPAIDPEQHHLVIHGLVERPIVFGLEDLKRFPAVTRVHYLECSGNGRTSYRAPKPEMTPQKVYGLTGNTEWTGLTVAQLFREVGVKPEAKWFLAEGGDACLMSRSVPVEKGWQDALIVWGQNGEPLRPEQGYPLRLLLPGFEGNMSVKWLRRLELGAAPWMTRWETSKYTDPLPDGTSRQFSFAMDATSIITAPATPSLLSAKGWWPVTGLAWTGRGKITRVEVSVDGGRNWHDAELQEPVLDMAHTRFSYPWEWNGKETVLLSRATDQTGYVQPMRARLLEVRGQGTDFHFNHVKGWRIRPDGKILYHGET